ncbi:MAG: PIN domain-containing protein [Chloroflexi bacterium]|nr:PIN domain-containing protein [Chloroflexota bacterium]
MAYVLDTTALVSYFKAELLGAQVRDMLLQQPSNLLLPFMAIMEAQYVLARTFTPAQVGQLIATLRALGAPVVESDPAWGAAAARVKSSGGLSLADAWIASLALMHDAELVHKDPEFDRVKGLRSYRLD